MSDSLLIRDRDGEDFETGNDSFSDHDSVGLTFEPVEKHSFKQGDGAPLHPRHSSSSLSSDLELRDLHPAFPQEDEEAALTGRVKGEQEAPEEEETYPDGRHSVESVGMWREARQAGKRAFIRKALVNGCLIALW